jgi:two-component system chemotaxis sensor kinase CheA
MFFEEARELLISLEEGLIELERRQGDRAHLDKTFRAAHSIKGAAAMVGLADIAAFTHGLETVLDKIRAAQLKVDSYTITTLLEGRDHLAAMIEGEALGLPVPPSSELNERLLSIVSDPEHPPAKPPPAAGPPPQPPSSPAPPTPEPPTESDSSASASEPAPPGRPKKPRVRKPKAPAPSLLPGRPDRPHYRIALRPGPETLRRGINPLGVLDELRELGQTTVRANPETVPPLEEIDPERCYLAWEIDLETDAPPERLDDVFLFVAEDSTVTIERVNADGSIEPIRSMTPAVAEVAAPAARSPAVAMAADASAESAPAPATASAAGGPPAKPPTTVAAPGGSVPPPPHAPRSSPRIRVDAAQLDDLVGLAGELAVLSDNLQALRETPGALKWVSTLESLERVSRQIRDTTLDLRMVAVDELFSRFRRVIRDLSDRTRKDLELRIVGEETRLDRTIIERLGAPLTHLINNAADHAIEPPEARVAVGKPRAGRITLSAGNEGDRVTIRVSDDGKGLDRERIVRKGIALGLVPYGTSPDDPRVVGLIFEPGFSTMDKVGERSGRGVGLDVVRDEIRALRGSLEVQSTPGVGTTFIFRLPLTLALIDGLLVETAGSRYVVPLAQVEECVALNGTSRALSEGRPCVAVRGELVPMVPLRKLFQAGGQTPARQELLLTTHAGQRVGIAVDRLLGRVQAVIQALGEGLQGLSRFSGATILGDGSVSLILDLAALVLESRSAENYKTSPNGGRAEGF